MSVAIGVAWIVFAALWESAALPEPSLAGVPADAVLLIILLWAYIRSAEQAIAMALVAGLALDLMSSHPVGISALALFPAAVMGSIRGARILDTDWIVAVVLAAAATISYHLLLWSMLRLSGVGPEFGLVWGDVLTATMLNGLLAPLLYLILRITSFDMRLSKRQIRTG